MKLTVKKGTTNKILHVFISDSSSTTGAGLTGLLFNSASLVAYYVRPGSATATQIALATISTLGSWETGGFKEFDATNMPGVYEFHLPDAVLASGVDNVIIMLKGATNMAPLPMEIQLIDNTELDIYARIGAPVGASISVDIANVNDNVIDEVVGDAVHATPNSVGAMIHAVYCRMMQKRTATTAAEVSYKLDDVTPLKTFTLSDDDITVTRL